MAGCYECGNYNPGSIKCGKMLEEQKNFVGSQKTDCALWSWLDS